MRVLKWMVVLVVLVAVVVGFFVLVPFGPSPQRANALAAGPESAKGTFVEISPGTGTVGIAKALERAGVVRSALAFEGVRAYEGVAGSGGTLKAGEYRFDHAASVMEVYDRLRRGDVYTVTLVVPEGFNLFDVAAAVEGAGLGSGADFLAAARQHTELITQWSPHAVSLEGYLFPDTYKFGRHATDAQMLAAMVKRFGQQVGRLGLGEPPGVGAFRTHAQKTRMNGLPGELGWGVGQVVTMASLVEKEVHLDAERPEVASVFFNRLAAGMPLQTDPAVIYASMLRGTWTGVIHQSELHSDSAYNTYAHGGLPPGPICSPGMAALRAVLHPAKTEYLYFVADANGATRFAATLKEHDANVARARE